MNSFDVAAGLGFEPRLTDPLEPFSFTDRADAEGQGETKQRFYQVLALLEGQGETPGYGQIAVKNLELFKRILEPKVAEGYQNTSSRRLGVYR